MVEKQPDLFARSQVGDQDAVNVEMRRTCNYREALVARYHDKRLSFLCMGKFGRSNSIHRDRFRGRARHRRRAAGDSPNRDTEEPAESHGARLSIADASPQYAEVLFAPWLAWESRPNGDHWADSFELRAVPLPAATQRFFADETGRESIAATGSRLVAVNETPRRKLHKTGEADGVSLLHPGSTRETWHWRPDLPCVPRLPHFRHVGLHRVMRRAPSRFVTNIARSHVAQRRQPGHQASTW